MPNINEAKQFVAADTPILFFECTMATGDTLFWSSHSVFFGGQNYEARILKHNLFTLQLAADDAMDGMSQLSLTLGNADGVMSELNASIGFRGAQLTANFAFVDLPSGAATTEAIMLFRGVAGDPEEITEESLTLVFTNKLSLQRVALPDVRVQRTCPWNFPATQSQRQEAVDGGAYGRFSRFYRCGYSAGVPGGTGNLNGTVPFTTCDKSRTQCTERGMFNSDSSGNVNNRYGGFDFVPTSYLVRGAGDKTAHLSAVIDNTAKYNDPLPLVYGTGWLKAPVIFSRNDGNLTHMEVLLGLGPIQGVLKVVVNDVEIPASAGNAAMFATGWYGLVSDGGRQGSFNLDFADSSGAPLGDPHGSVAVLSVVVPNAISPGTSSPTVQVLLTGTKVDTYDTSLAKSLPAWNNNPAWILLDVLQRSGWTASDLDLLSFVEAAQHCNEAISTTDINGNAVTLPRYGCNLILTKRQSAAVVVRGIRVGSSLMLRYGTDGLLELLPEGTLASQQSVPPDGTNSEALNGGYPAYEFSDASDKFSGIARNSHGGSSLRITALSVSETSNRLSLEFQDEKNEYQQDSLSILNSDDADLIGFEVASQSTALGIPNYNQATRILLRQLDKSTAGNQYIQFQTSFRALKVRPGDIIALTYERENFVRSTFRVLKISPSINYELVTILAQIHDDNWYSDDPAVLQASGRQPQTALGVPRPLLGTIAHLPDLGQAGYFDFGTSDAVSPQKDGSAIDHITIGFSVPAKPAATSGYLPLVSLTPDLATIGGTLPGDSVWYYAITAVDESGAEGTLSFNIRASLPAVSNANVVTLKELSFPKTAVSFNVYRGASPQLLFRIAGAQAIADTFTDIGYPIQPIGPPDPNFDHANIYYRNEYAGPFNSDSSSANSIGCSGMGALGGVYADRVALIVEGTGKGQERSILTNTASTLTLRTAWAVVPDNSSIFVISEAAWKLAAVSAYSPAQFDISYRLGGVIQVTGRAANAANQESNADLSPITRFHLGGGAADFGVPPVPSFELITPGAGDITIFGVGFQDLTNADTITSGTMKFIYWNEAGPATPYSLTATVDDSTATITLAGPATNFIPGSFIQIDQELMSVVSASANVLTVFRGSTGSIAAPHTGGVPAMLMQTYIIIMPFAAGFFQNRASNNYIHTINIPDIRISAAQLLMSNAFGNSQAGTVCYTANTTQLRTLSGGQYSLQVNGYLASQQNAAPPLVVQGPHAVRDARMTFGQAPAGYVVTVDILQQNVQYLRLIYDPGDTVPSPVIDGLSIPVLQEGALLTMNITLSLIPNYNQALSPGRDLTVTIRL